jgi:hypothetical protein
LWPQVGILFFPRFPENTIYDNWKCCVPCLDGTSSMWHATCVQFASLKKVKVELALCILRWLCHNDVRPTQLNKWYRVFGELGALPKIRKENVSELQMVFEFFRFMWVL